MNLLNLKNKKGIFAKVFVLLPLLVVFFIPQSVFAATSDASLIQGLTQSNLARESSAGWPKPFCFEVAGNVQDANSKEQMRAQQHFCFSSETTCKQEMTRIDVKKIALTGAITSRCVDNSKSLLSKVIGWLADKLLGATLWIVAIVLKFIGYILFNIAVIWLKTMSFVLNEAIARTILPSTYTGLDSVFVGWTIIRDVANMSFIFMLLYISIATVLDMQGAITKKMAANIVIAALLVNFSLFGTQVVIDAGNMLAVGFWNKMQMSNGADTTAGVSGQFLQAFNLESLVAGKDEQKALATEKKNGDGENTTLNQAIVYLGGALIMFVAGYLFFAGAMMMIIRTVKLLFLMIASPIAVMGFVIPKLSGVKDGWWKELTGQVFVAPVFIFMLYLNSILVKSLDLAKLSGQTAGGAKFAEAFGGMSSSMTIIYNFILIIYLLLTSMTVASWVSSGAASTASKWAKGGIGMGGGAALWSGGEVGRQSLGRIGNTIEKSEWLRAKAAKGGRMGRLANLSLAAAGRAKEGSFDVRNSKVAGYGLGKLQGATGVGFGKGSERSRAKHDENRKKKDEEIVKTYMERYKKNPEALEAQLRAKFGDRYDSDDMKATLKEANGAIKRGKAMGVLKDGQSTGAQITAAMKDLSVSDRAELAEKLKSNPAFINSLTKNDLAAINKLEADGKYSGVADSIANEAMNGTNFELQKYLASDEGQGKLLQTNFGTTEMQAHTDRVKKQVEAMKTRVNDLKKAQAEANKLADTVNSAATIEKDIQDELNQAQQKLNNIQQGKQDMVHPGEEEGLKQNIKESQKKLNEHRESVADAKSEMS